MHSLSLSCVVNVPRSFAFELTSNLANWPRMNPTCKRIEVVASEGHKRIFCFGSSDQTEWLSTIFVDSDGGFTFSERHDPPPPLAVLQFVRLYRALGESQTEIIEEVIYEMRAGDEDRNEEVRGRLLEHNMRIQPVIKTYLEDAYAQSIPQPQ
jgi:hypothetical protein